MKIIQPRPHRRFHDLLMMWTQISNLVPPNPNSSVVAVGRNLHHCPRPVFVVPAQPADEFFVPPVSPQFDLERLDRMNAKFRRFPAAHELRPGVTEQTVGEESEMVA